MPGGYYAVQEAKVVKSGNFTGFVYYVNEKAADGSTYDHRYSFRFYNTGKCEARVDQSGYKPLVATGRVGLK